MIHVLEGDDGPVSDSECMKKIALDYYRKLFGWEPKAKINRQDDFHREEEKVFAEENVKLEAKFSREEIRAVVFGSYSDGALGSNGLPFMFF